jgi:hypothetical protein
MESIYIIWGILGLLFIIGSVVEANAHKKAEIQLDLIDRETLGKKYYEELWGRGSWKNGK